MSRGINSYIHIPGQIYTFISHSTSFMLLCKKNILPGLDQTQTIYCRRIILNNKNILNKKKSINCFIFFFKFSNVLLLKMGYVYCA